jgi:hypothetical protein
VVAAFKEGSISGFLSNLVAFLINNLIKTSKKFVRIIREGFLSLIKAIKTIVHPDEGMTKYEAIKAGIKLISTAVITSLGILLEQSVNAFLTTFPFLAPISGILSSAIVGIATGIVAVVVIYLLDRFFEFKKFSVLRSSQAHKFFL